MYILLIIILIKIIYTQQKIVDIFAPYKHHAIMETLCNKSRNIYVNCNSSSRIQNGKSWKTPYSDLQSALVDAADAYTKIYILIAKGTYIPTEIYSPSRRVGGASGLNDTSLRTFNIPNNTTLVGGFKGNEECRKESSCENITILSGLNIYWHVVTVGNDIHPDMEVNVSLNNLVIEGGNAQGPKFNSVTSVPFNYDHSSGGGMYIVHESRVKLTNITIRNNSCGYPSDSGKYAGFGGGIFCSNSKLCMNKCQVSYNAAGAHVGGIAILNTFEGDKQHSSIIKNCQFEYNMAPASGGALAVKSIMGNKQTSVLVESCTFNRNSSRIGGAGLCDTTNVKFRDCTFNNNASGVSGGALAITSMMGLIWNVRNDTKLVPRVVDVSNCTFDCNTSLASAELQESLEITHQHTMSSRGGGAIACYLGGLVNVSDCMFSNNIDERGNGGAILNGGARIEVAHGNVVNNESATTRVNKCRFLNNSTLFGNGGAIASIGDDTVVLDISHVKFRNNAAPNGIGNDVYLSNPK
jgi:hypothetical protein